MKIILAGGSGYLGKLLAKYYVDRGHIVVVLTRGKTQDRGIKYVNWNGKESGSWVKSLEGADVLINLTGKNVNCRYTKKNKNEIINSRVNSVKVLVEAMSSLQSEIPLWIQSSSATIYRHAEDRPMTENDGEAGSGFSVEVCKQWEKVFVDAPLPATRKIILRTGIVFGKNEGAFPILKNLTRAGLGGRMGNGNQRISWIHEHDFLSCVDWLINNPDASGIYNCTSPGPIQNKDLMHALKARLGSPISLPSPIWLLTIGAYIIGTETELVLKSRWVLPERLLQEGFSFQYATFSDALPILVT